VNPLNEIFFDFSIIWIGFSWESVPRTVTMCFVGEDQFPPNT
jgi:hypothetical protein